MSINLWNCSTALLLAGMSTIGLFWLGPTLLNAGLITVLQTVVLLLIRIFSDER